MKQKYRTDDCPKCGRQKKSNAKTCWQCSPWAKTPDPTEAEIAEHCERLQATWDDTQRRVRAGMSKKDAVEPPVILECEIVRHIQRGQVRSQY